MEAKNLRVGNLLRMKGDNHTVTEVFNVGESEFNMVDGGDMYGVIGTPFSEAEPIELTREWFHKYGFHESNGFWIDLTTHYLEMISTIEDNGDRYYYPVYAQVPELSSEDEQRVGLNRIRYVHELQNLFFALTGRELEFVAETST